jgi:hypothetical protein
MKVASICANISRLFIDTHIEPSFNQSNSYDVKVASNMWRPYSVLHSPLLAAQH